MDKSDYKQSEKYLILASLKLNYTKTSGMYSRIKLQKLIKKVTLDIFEGV